MVNENSDANIKDEVTENLEQLVPKDITVRKRVLAALLRSINSDNKSGGR